MRTSIKNPHTCCWLGKNYFLVFFIILGLISAHPHAFAQQARKVKIFLMAGQSNMQGHADGDQLKRILCAKDALNLPDDAQGCYRSLADQEERLFHTISDFYGTHPTYDSGNARREAQLISQYELVNKRLLYPFDRVQAINFNYSRNNGVRSGPAIWSGSLTTGFGHSNNGKSYGPELMFGHYMAQFTEDDIVLVKVVEGGTNLHVQWRSPGAEARLGPANEPSNYPLLMQHINEIKSNIGNYIPRYQGQNVETEIAGFVWFQGWNDALSSVYAPEYERNLTDLITDLRNDLALPALPVVISQTQNDGANGLIVQAAQKAVGDNIGHAASVATTDLSNYFHFDSGSPLIIGSRMGEKMKDLLGLEEVPATAPAAPSGLLAVAHSTSKIQLNWTDNADNEERFWLERSTNAETGFEVIASVSANTTSYLDQGLSQSTTYYYRVSGYNYKGDSEYSNTGIATTYEPITAIPAEWDSVIVGNPVLGGRLRYFEGAFTIEGSGELWGNSDKFYYVFQRFSGDGEIIARINSVTEPNQWARAGVMIRETLNVDAKYAMTMSNAKRRHTVQGRINNSEMTFLTGETKMGFPSWVKLVRSGNLFTGYQSADGIAWQQIHQVTINMAASVYIGLAVSNANVPSVRCTAVFSDVVINQSNLPPVAPSNLVAAASATNSINLAWADHSGIETGFSIERSLNGETGFTEITTVSANTNFYHDTGLSPGTTYYYRVHAYNSNGDSEYTEVASAQTEGDPVPSAPSGLTATNNTSPGIRLSWIDNSEIETGFKVERSLDSLTGFNAIAIVSANTLFYQDKNVSPGTFYYYRIQAFNQKGNSAYSEVAGAQAADLVAGVPVPWTSRDIGSPVLAGQAGFLNGTFTVNGSGELWGKSDKFHYVFQRFAGNGEIIAQINSITEPNQWARAGVMIRETLNVDAKYAMTMSNAKRRHTVQGRIDNSEMTFLTGETQISFPSWVKLVRSGNLFTGYQSADGITWQQIHQVTIGMADSVYIGLAVSNANIPSVRCTAVFSQVSLNLLPSDLTPPSALTAKNNGSKAIALSWTDNSENEAGFKIERSANATTGFEEVMNVPLNTTSFVDRGLSPLTTYYYRVRAYNENGHSGYIETASAKTREPGIEKLILCMPRLANNKDISLEQNTISITTNADAAGETHPHVGLLGKQIRVQLGNPVASRDVTISIKIIPGNLTQTTDLLQAGAIKITQKADVVSATIGNQVIENPAKLSTVTCNHLALRVTQNAIAFYVNGVWATMATGQAVNFSAVVFGPYNGRLWDLRIFDEYIDDGEIGELSQYCLPNLAVNNPPNSNYPKPLCAAYVCLWSDDTRNLLEPKYQGYLTQQELSYENAVFKVEMHPHGDLENFVKSFKNRNVTVASGAFIDGNTFPLTRTTSNYWVHENFHSFQGFHPDAAYGKSKWLAESTAEWAPDAIYPGATSTLLGFYTLHPHLPLYAVVDSPVGDYYGKEFVGGRNYGSYVFFSYITNFVTNDSFIGKVYNTKGPILDITAIDQVLAGEGHDLPAVFGDFAAHITVWDFADGTGPYFKDSEQRSLNRMKGARPEAAVFSSKITDTLTVAGTGGDMVSIPQKMVPGAWAFNAYKVDNTSAGIYRIRLQGLASNPANTKFQARVMVGANGVYEYFTFSIDSLAAFGVTATEMDVVTTAGKELYLVVATTPDGYMGYENHYRYTYSIEAMPPEAGAHTDANARARKEGVAQTSLESGDITVYPNKTDGNLTISLTADEFAEIRIVNASGMEIPFKAEQNTNMIQVHFEGPSGLYIIRVRTKYYTKNLKILKK